jgi:hypothetical protein
MPPPARRESPAAATTVATSRPVLDIPTLPELAGPALLNARR